MKHSCNCRSCKQYVEMILLEETFKNGTRHIAKYCPKCGKHNAYLPLPNGESVYPFGKYKGVMFKDLPDSFLDWGMKTLSPKIAKRLKNEKNRRATEIKTPAIQTEIDGV